MDILRSLVLALLRLAKSAKVNQAINELKIAPVYRSAECDWPDLRCPLPPASAHDTGLVTLQVALTNQILSNSVVFEYKARALPSLPSSQHDWLSLDGRSALRS